MFKKKYKTNKAPTNGNPYFNETNSFEDERGNDIAAKVSWRNIAFLLVLLMFISVGGNIYQGTQSKTVVKVYKEDKYGGLYYMGTADEALQVTNNNIGNYLMSIISALRSVPIDIGVRKSNANLIQAYSSQSLFDNVVRPMLKARYIANQNILVSINAAIPINKSTWEIDWTETNGITEIGKFKAMIGFSRQPPDDKQSTDFQYINPLGIVITDITVTQELK